MINLSSIGTPAFFTARAFDCAAARYSDIVVLSDFEVFTKHLIAVTAAAMLDLWKVTCNSFQSPLDDVAVCARVSTVSERQSSILALALRSRFNAASSSM